MPTQWRWVAIWQQKQITLSFVVATMHTDLTYPNKHILNTQALLELQQIVAIIRAAFHQTGQEFFEETRSDHSGVNPPDLICLRHDPSPFWLDPHPAAVKFIVASEGRRRTPPVRRNDSSTCYWRNVTVQTVRSSPLGVQEFRHLWKSLKCLSASAGVSSEEWEI